MTIEEFLDSLTEIERNYISKLDYNDRYEKHREELDEVIKNKGLVNFDKQGYWFPYEVIELGKNVLVEGHEREFTACLLIVLINIFNGGDKTNEIDYLVERSKENIKKLPLELRNLIDLMIVNIIDKE